ncbi:hypothetical protein AMIS_78560 [Actinoplanes missouriensis 431]|uniref:Uncharacterized protein n=1 Tax=Actinoplanes missouriensis (strain ATCC 14538 / DSM 43046 / CBS 188.64 / JCM 3121 / NBRC 102363 / NCIMB 12654 / NRRL B-3342 / UNCC 431) TaxID=512565 RepID=I0HJ89_ACTM4|nr:hypothetical protein AMIS_78560 [Actinoplanes missouriensis 431]
MEARFPQFVPLASTLAVRYFPPPADWDRTTTVYGPVSGNWQPASGAGDHDAAPQTGAPFGPSTRRLANASSAPDRLTEMISRGVWPAAVKQAMKSSPVNATDAPRGSPKSPAGSSGHPVEPVTRCSANT